MKELFKFLIIITLTTGCGQKNDLRQYGKHYQKHQDYKSLQKVIELLPENVDTAEVKKILGEPISMGFDFRYTVDSTGVNGCVVGAVLNINNIGRISNKWSGEICE
ncbi:MAG: hypothetical protein WCP85_27275 [Mariniphaga sp.]